VQASTQASILYQARTKQTTRGSSSQGRRRLVSSADGVEPMKKPSEDEAAPTEESSEDEVESTKESSEDEVEPTKEPSEDEVEGEATSIGS